MNKNKQSGFTIVELIVVIVVIGILAAVTIVSYGLVQSNAIATGLQSDLNNASDLLRVDQANSGTGTFPATLAAANGGSGVPSSPNTNYSYVVNNTNTPKTFCLTATKGGQSYFTTQEGKSSIGSCPALYYDIAVPTSYPGSGTTLFDLSGNINNGTFVGGVSYSTVNGGVLSFNGVDGRVESAVRTYGNNTTWTTWIKCDQSMSIYNMFMGSHLPYFGFYNGNSLIFSNMIGGSQRTITSPANLTLSTWYYTAFTSEYDGTNMTDKIYVNGSFKTSGQWAGVQSNPGYKFTVGDGHTPTWYPFNGEVSNVKIYNYTLSADEINHNFSDQRGRYGV